MLVRDPSEGLEDDAPTGLRIGGCGGADLWGHRRLPVWQSLPRIGVGNGAASPARFPRKRPSGKRDSEPDRDEDKGAHNAAHSAAVSLPEGDADESPKAMVTPSLRMCRRCCRKGHPRRSIPLTPTYIEGDGVDVLGDTSAAELALLAVELAGPIALGVLLGSSQVGACVILAGLPLAPREVAAV